MTGSPLFRLMLVVAAMLALLVPLRRLTRHAPAGAAPAAVAAPDKSVAVHIALSSTKKPFHFEIDHLGKPLWTGDAADNEVEKDIQMPFPREGVDLLVSVSWTDSEPAVLKVEVTPDGGDAITKMLWGNNSVSDVLTFK